MPIEVKDQTAYYVPPMTKYGEEYWVPIVVKNRDSLISFQEGALSALDLVEAEGLYSPTMFLSSERFIDITPDGDRLNGLNESELKAYIKDKIERGLNRINDPDPHLDDVNIDFDDYFLTLSCSCGNFFGFYDSFDIPEEDHHCDVCGKKLIEYIHLDDALINFEGVDPILYAELVQEIKSEINDDFDPDF